MSNPSVWDETEVVENEIRPRVQEIADICKARNIPMFALFVPSGDEQKVVTKGMIVDFRNTQVVRGLLECLNDNTLPPQEAITPLTPAGGNL